MSGREILYCHVKRKNQKGSAGHWFFDMEQRLECAQVCCGRNGRWSLLITSEVSEKPLPEPALEFDSIDEAKVFIANYFGLPIRQVEPSGFPPIYDTE